MKKILTAITVYLISLAFIIAGILYWIDYSGKNISNSQKTKGQIIRIFKKQNSSTMYPFNGIYSFRPIVKFKTNDGDVYQFIDLYAESEDSFRIGQIVTVIYNNQDPNEAKIQKNNPFWGEHLILIILGVTIITLRIIIRVKK